MTSQGCLSLIKYCLFLFNLLFFCLGMLLLSLGLWILFDETSFFLPPPSSMSLSLLSYFLAIGGTVTMAVGFFGCLGALKEVKCMLGMYFFLLTILLASQIVGGVLLFTQKNAFEDRLREHVIQIITSFRKNESSFYTFKKTLDYIQREIHCCGWSGPDDWVNHGVNKPPSCYQPVNTTVFHNHSLSNIPEMRKGMNRHELPLSSSNYTSSIYEQGCKVVFKKWLQENMLVIFGILFAVVLVELCGMTLSMCLYRQINLDYNMLTRYS
ncbi:hypothetical protein MATL_G00021330 [Megalops atlanticus]|uniref:Tetraspanin n=1 Tax=Megalops atlanticus TaxID=7932 RepID=A0A9D3TEV0_MEGAT|nr:hypothetical protein MATL_G00021330 [Megalops atlanticus]